MRHPVGRELPGAQLPPVVQRLAEVEAVGDPLDLLLEVSALLADVEHPEAELDVRGLVQLLVEHEAQATSAALTILGRLAPDDVLRARARREVRLRGDDLPDWLGDLDRLVTVAGARGDGIRLELRTRPAHPARRPLAVLHARLDHRGEVVGGSVAPSRPLSSWPDCRALLRWATRVAPAPASP